MMVPCARGPIIYDIRVGWGRRVDTLKANRFTGMLLKRDCDKRGKEVRISKHFVDIIIDSQLRLF